MKSRHCLLRACQVRARAGVMQVSVVSVVALQAESVLAQSFLVFQPFTPYVTGDSRLIVDRDLFNTRDARLVSSQEFSTRLSGRYGGRGYVWRPWFSDLTADADLNIDHRVVGGDASSNESVGWDGSLSASLNLVPRSHVPFSARTLYSRDDQQSELFRVTLNQEIKTFNPAAPDYRFSYEFEDRQRRQSQSTDHDFISSLSGKHLRHDYRGDFQVLDTQSSSPSSSSQTRTYNLTADHRYQWSSALQQSEFVSAFDSSTDTGVSELWSGGVQANALFSWQPLGSWSANAALSARQNESESIAEERLTIRSTEFQGSAALMYRPSDEFSSNFTSTYDWLDSNQGQIITESSHSLDAFYTPAGIALGEFDYRWDALGRFRVRRIDSEQTEDGTFALGHNVARRWGTSGSEWTFDASQDASYQYMVAGEAGSAIQLTQRVSLSWRGQAETYRDFAFIGFADSRELFGSEKEAQSIDLSFNRQGALGRFSSWEVDFNYQVFRDVDEQGAAEVDDLASSRGNLLMIYTRANVLGVYNLQFRSELDAQLDYDGEDDSVTRDSSWENTLEYQLGRLSSELTLELTEADDGATGSLFFQVRRRWDSR